MFQMRTYGKMVFFNRSIIRSNWSKINRGPMQRAGNYVRMVARGSIRRVGSGKPSKPGSPPRSHRQGTTPPFKMIYSVPNSMGTSVMVGMVWFGTYPPVPGLHEHGGHAIRTTRDLVGFRGGNKHIPVYYKTRTRVYYPPRPFMRPALEKAWAQGKITPLWRNSLSAA